MKVGKTDSHRNGKLDDNKALAQLGFQVKQDDFLS
jgi:histone deacetylase complex subunit SAP18